MCDSGVFYVCWLCLFYQVSLTKRQPSNKKDVPKPKKKKLDEDIQSDSGSEMYVWKVFV